MATNQIGLASNSIPAKEGFKVGAEAQSEKLPQVSFDEMLKAGAIEKARIASEQIDQGKLSVSTPPILNIEDSAENLILPGEHYYTHLSDKVCKAGEVGCSLADVVEVLNERAAHPEQVRPFIPGQPYKADVALLKITTDPIETVALYNKEGQQHGLRNITLEGHLLHPGTISRYIISKNGWFHILTVGEGTGKFGGPNHWLEDLVWNPVNQLVIDAFKQKSEYD